MPEVVERAPDVDIIFVVAHPLGLIHCLLFVFTLSGLLRKRICQKYIIFSYICQFMMK